MDVKRRKLELRELIWARLQDEGVARFPGARGRIPNFIGAEAAAAELKKSDFWNGARTLKCNPDSPQLPVRKNALGDGKTVYMAVPRLADTKPFFALDPKQLEVALHEAASIKGAARHGRPVGVEAMPRVDLVIAGSVAVSADGARLGKGGGFSDLEFALARQAGLITDRTVIVTTVHHLQIVDEGEIPMTQHDVPLDFIVTPDQIIPTSGGHSRPPGILWAEFDPEMLDSIPVLRELRNAGSAGQ